MAYLGLDMREAAWLARLEKYGDWYRDPWGWPEFDEAFVVSRDIEEDFGIERDGKKFVARLRPAFHVFDVPKSFVGTRPAVIQDPASRLLYTAAAANVSRTLHGDLPAWAFGWRLREGEFAKTTDEWKLYELSRAVISDAKFGAQTDISSFFSSVEVGNFLESLTGVVGENVQTSALRVILTAHNGMTSRSGLPQRSTASALLAHLVLSEVDDLIDRYLTAGDLLSARRWMDDFSFEGKRKALYRLIGDLQAAARKVGLEINSSKTFIDSGAESARRLSEETPRRITLPRVEEGDGYGGSSTYLDQTELEDLEQAALARPANASRQNLVNILRSLARYSMFDRAGEWRDASFELPHAADALSRYLAKAHLVNPALDLETWFVRSAKARWAQQEWVLAQHAIVFASDDLPPAVADILRGWLQRSTTLQQLAVSIHRLAQAEPKTLRSILTDRVDRVHDPLVLRLIGMGLVAGGSSKAAAGRALGLAPENSLTLKLLQSRDWELPVVAKDFDGVSDVDDEGVLEADVEEAGVGDSLDQVLLDDPNPV